MLVVPISQAFQMAVHPNHSAITAAEVKYGVVNKLYASLAVIMGNINLLMKLLIKKYLNTLILPPWLHNRRSIICPHLFFFILWRNHSRPHISCRVDDLKFGSPSAIGARLLWTGYIPLVNSRRLFSLIAYFSRSNIKAQFSPVIETPFSFIVNW